jgi:hypothetical protein
MKALLQTICGCTQVIEIADRIHVLKMPIITPLIAYYQKSGKEISIRYREFYYDHIENLNGTGEILVYKEYERNN